MLIASDLEAFEININGALMNIRYSFMIGTGCFNTATIDTQHK